MDAKIGRGDKEERTGSILQRTLRIHDDAVNKVIWRQANWSELEKRVGYHANPGCFFC